MCTKIHNRCWWQKLNLGFHGLKSMPFQSNIIWFCNILCQKKNITCVYFNSFYKLSCVFFMKQILNHFWNVFKGLHNVINKHTKFLNIKKIITRFFLRFQGEIFHVYNFVNSFYNTTWSVIKNYLELGSISMFRFHNIPIKEIDYPCFGTFKMHY